MQILNEEQLRQWRIEFTERALQFAGMAQWCETMLACVNPDAHSASTLSRLPRQVAEAQAHSVDHAMTFHVTHMVKRDNEEAQLRLL